MIEEREREKRVVAMGKRDLDNHTQSTLFTSKRENYTGNYNERIQSNTAEFPQVQFMGNIIDEMICEICMRLSMYVRDGGTKSTIRMKNYLTERY